MSGPLLALLLALPAHASGPTGRNIRIALFVEAEKLTLEPEHLYAALDARGDAHDLLPDNSYTAESEDGRVRVGSLHLNGPVRLKPDRQDGVLRLGGRRFKGEIVLRPAPGETLTVVQEIGIEDYLLGVLPHEMSPDWPIESLKAQAVVARTFAYTQMGKYRDKGFDLTSDVRSQMYKGVTTEADSVRRAVTETRGEVLGYKGKILDVYYHSCCGGHTADAGRVWGANEVPPPLRGVKDRYCESSPHSRWTAYFPYDGILPALQKKLMTAGKLKRFEVGHKDRRGYVTYFIYKLGSETATIKAAELRAALGSALLKSTRISRIRRLGSGVEFLGSGFGHGVGLCQWGARLQAERGRGYETILKHYFPGSTLSEIDE